MPRSTGRRAVRQPAWARSRCGRSGKWSNTRPPGDDRGDDLMEGPTEIARAAAEAAARQSYGKLIAWLSSRTNDVAGAEAALADVFAAALERGPRRGVPDKPEAWLLAVARRRRIDALRRRLTTVAGRDHLLLMT